jgi:cytochrome c
MKSVCYVALVTLLAGAGCEQEMSRAGLLSSRKEEAGRHAIEYYGCASCHVIPGVAGADGLVGPSLQQIGERTYIGGVAKNTPENLVRWIRDAPGVEPHTAMPRLDIPEAEASKIAAYLYTLK